MSFRYRRNRCYGGYGYYDDYLDYPFIGPRPYPYCYPYCYPYPYW